jgi:ATP-binding protein involved in chromosome partitioning
MRIAIPMTTGQVSMHFGHSAGFALIDVDQSRKQITGKKMAVAPEHEPGLLPTWLAENGVDLVIAGDIGRRAQRYLSRKGIQVVVGAGPETPERLVTDYLQGTLQTGDNLCEH